MAWEVDSDRIESWLLTLDHNTYVQVFAALTVLGDEGPQLGRPLVDTVTASKHKNMKELRPGSSGRREVRVLFAFDPERKAILLLGGDKSGQWSKWYRTAIPQADIAFDEHLETLKKPKQGRK
jgi:hypothetical protein